MKSFISFNLFLMSKLNLTIYKQDQSEIRKVSKSFEKFEIEKFDIS